MISLEDLGVAPVRDATLPPPPPPPPTKEGTLKVRRFWDGVTGETARICRDLLDIGMDSQSLGWMLGSDMAGDSARWDIVDCLRFSVDLDESLWTDEEFAIINAGPQGRLSPLLGLVTAADGGTFRCDRIVRAEIIPAGTRLWVQYDGADHPALQRDFTSTRDVWRACSPQERPVPGWRRSAERFFLSRLDADRWLDDTLCRHF